MYADCLVSFRRAHEAMQLAADEEHATPQARAARIRQAHREATEAARDVLRRDLSSLDI